MGIFYRRETFDAAQGQPRADGLEAHNALCVAEFNGDNLMRLKTLNERKI